MEMAHIGNFGLLAMLLLYNLDPFSWGDDDSNKTSTPETDDLLPSIALTDDADMELGTDGNDTILALGGDDTVSNGAGDDDIEGNPVMTSSTVKTETTVFQVAQALTHFPVVQVMTSLALIVLIRPQTLPAAAKITSAVLLETTGCCLAMAMWLLVMGALISLIWWSTPTVIRPPQSATSTQPRTHSPYIWMRLPTVKPHPRLIL